MHSFTKLSRGRKAFLLFVAFVLFFYIHFPPIIQVDVIASPYVAWSLARHGSFDTRTYPEVQSHVHAILLYTMPDGARISLFPPGSAIAAVPVVALFAAFREQPFGIKGMMHLGKLVAVLYAAGAVAITYMLMQRISRRGALASAILLGGGTVLYSTAAQSLWMHAPATFFVALSMYWQYCAVAQDRSDPQVVKITDKRSLISMAGSALAMGMGVFTRPTLLLFALAGLLSLLVMRRWRMAFIYTVGIAIPISLFFLYNEIHFHHPLSGGYGAGSDTYVWSTPLLHGLYGLTVSSNRGLFIFTPGFLLVPAGIFFLFRRNYSGVVRIFVVSFLLASIATILTYSKWWAWYGGWCYGPRYLCEIGPALVLCVSIALAHITSRFAHGLALFTIGLSILIHVAGVFGDNNQWSRRHNIGATTALVNASMDEGMFNWGDSQIVTSLRHMLHF